MFTEEIVALTGIRPGRGEQVTLELDEGNRPSTMREGLAGLPAVLPDREGHRATVSAGNASQLSDGAAALVMMEASEATRRGLEPLGTYRGIAVAGCEPDEMGIGPVFAVPRLLERHGLTVQDIDLWELNEAFASQAVYCRDRLGIDPDKYNVNGGAIAIGHPYGMSGVRGTGAIHGLNRRAQSRQLGPRRSRGMSSGSVRCQGGRLLAAS